MRGPSVIVLCMLFRIEMAHTNANGLSLMIDISPKFRFCDGFAQYNSHIFLFKVRIGLEVGGRLCFREFYLNDYLSYYWNEPHDVHSKICVFRTASYMLLYMACVGGSPHSCSCYSSVLFVCCRIMSLSSLLVLFCSGVLLSYTIININKPTA